MLKKIFKKKSNNPLPRGFNELSVSSVVRLTPESVQIELNVPESLNAGYIFQPGQYIDLEVELDGKKHRRSYSICNGPNQQLAFAVKKVHGGVVSQWMNSEVKPGQKLVVSKPQGSFVYTPEMKSIVCFAAGSGITPIKSIVEFALANNADVHLVYSNQSQESSMFLSEMKTLLGDRLHLVFSREKVEGCLDGRLDDDKFSSLIKANLEWLKADAIFFCGPSAMIDAGIEKMKLFGVSESKLYRELFTASGMPQEETASAEEAQNSDVTVILDGEEISLKYKKNGKGLLDLMDSEGYDPPYSCRGGVCSTCKAQVLEGSAEMKVNYTLTEQEIQAGAILCCQAVPTSPSLKLSFDE